MVLWPIVQLAKRELRPNSAESINRQDRPGTSQQQQWIERPDNTSACYSSIRLRAGLVICTDELLWEPLSGHRNAFADDVVHIRGRLAASLETLKAAGLA